MARRRRASSLPSSTPISIGNCEVIVEAKNFTSDLDRNSVEISISKTAKIKISVVGEVNRHDDSVSGGCEECGDCNFLLANPKDSDVQTKSLLQEVLTLYTKELPAMNYAANTGKESLFLERCVTNGKYCTLLLKSKDDKQHGEVIAAITYQIIPADTQYAEVPLAAVKSIFQHKGIGRLLYMELRKRLQSVGIRTLFCWGDKESEGFWLKQGFTVIGEVDKKGKARRLPVKADIRRALCFPGGSTLMVSHLLKDISSEPVELLPLCLPLKPPELNFRNQEPSHIAESHKPSKEVNQRAESGFSESEKVAEKFSVDGCENVGHLPIVKYCSLTNASGVKKGGIEDDEDNFSCSMQGTNKRTWEASCTSLKSKKVKGTHSIDCQSGSHCPVWNSYGRIVHYLDRNCMEICGNKLLSDTLQTNSGSNSMYGKNEECRAGNIRYEDYVCPETPDNAKCNRIMLMNIADDNKKSRLTKIIEDLGGVVTSDGNVSTHVITGQVRKTLNFCTALCSGAWIVSSGWLKESFKNGRFVDETPFVLKDEDYRTKYRIELKCAVLRAKATPNALFKGLDIWLATHVIRKQNEINDKSKTIFVACEEDMEEALYAVKLGIWTFSVEWLMNCVMRQELDLEAPQFAESL
ncbi:hypothetical protein BUALT_Bualt12G0025000 [Buddleja alternifolia]|uniref:Uncharacterized protein n=1 Tax=Buddleja alternifolia TaxID=168488 RepID=A0AAV6WUV0_9LAMI|nr:hypothetical protein BUALT_Bualt12G0025000 [Buddleja alternifolia]